MSQTRAALVTGANRGIGLEVARQLARAGMLVALGARDQSKGEAAAAELLRSEGLELPVIVVDTTDPESCRKAVADTAAMFSSLDVLVNNAGVFLEKTPTGESSAIDVSPRTVEATLTTNTIGPMVLTQAAIPLMLQQGYGRIVNMSSGMGQLADMGGQFVGYRMSKAALNAMTRTFAAELGEGPIKINSMCPGWVRTDMGGDDAARSIPEGADTAVWLATLPDDGPSGGFFRDRTPIDW